MGRYFHNDGKSSRLLHLKQKLCCDHIFASIGDLRRVEKGPIGGRSLGDILGAGRCPASLISLLLDGDPEGSGAKAKQEMEGKSKVARRSCSALL